MPTLEHRRARVRTEDAARQETQGSGVALPTLAAASASSVVAAIVVSHVWGPGTLYGAAATPIIVTLVSEAVQRPRRVLDTARTVRVARPDGRFDPVAEGRRGVAEGELREERVGDGVARVNVHRVEPRRRPRRRTVLAALLTGLLAFGVGAFVLTGGELVFGSGAAGGVGSRTTLFGGGTHHAATQEKTTTGQQSTQEKSTPTDSTPSTTQQTTQTTGTTTAPATPSSTGGTQAPPSTTTTGTTTTTPQQAPAPTTPAPTTPAAP